MATTSLLTATTAFAQPNLLERPETPAHREDADPVESFRTRMLTPAEALSVFGRVRSWVDRGAVPVEPAGDLPRSWVTSVVIRSGGRVIGRDTAVAADESGTARTIQQAAARAIRRAISNLEGAPDALRAERLREGLAGSRLSIEMTPQPPVPVAADIGVDNLDDWIRPGIEGLLVRRGSDVAASTPGSMLADGRSASNVFVGLVSELADDPSIALKSADELIDRGFKLSLFNVVHVAQTQAGDAPLLLHRGGRVAGPIRSTAEVSRLAGSIAEHILRRAWPGVERHGLRGDLAPVTGRFTPSVAPPFAQAFAAEALLRFADAPGVDAELAQRAGVAGEATLSALSVVEGAERAPWGDPVSASACLSALSLLDKLAIERSDELRALRNQCVRQVAGVFDIAAGYDPMVPATARGVVARGLLTLADFEPWDREAHLLRADEAIRAVFRETPPSQLLGVMPDLGWADIELAKNMGGDPKSAATLRELRETVQGLMLSANDLLDVDRDLRGGILLDTQGGALPTWQGLRPVGLLASMLGEPTLTPGTSRGGEALEQIVVMLELLRYVGQLTAEGRLGHMYTDPGLAMGGVRSSLWDQKMKLTASALGLITLTETLESLDQISARHVPAAGGP